MSRGPRSHFQEYRRVAAHIGGKLGFDQAVEFNGLSFTSIAPSQRKVEANAIMKRIADPPCCFLPSVCCILVFIFSLQSPFWRSRLFSQSRVTSKAFYVSCTRHLLLASCCRPVLLLHVASRPLSVVRCPSFSQWRIKLFLCFLTGYSSLVTGFSNSSTSSSVFCLLLLYSLLLFTSS